MVNQDVVKGEEVRVGQSHEIDFLELINTIAAQSSDHYLLSWLSFGDVLDLVGEDLVDGSCS